MSFLLSEYRDLLACVSASGWRFASVVDYLSAGDERRRFVILRHDVDRRPRKALEMARLEHALGVRSTYYFRIKRSGVFSSEVVREIAALGHEVGVHYETLAACNGDFRKAIELFERQLRDFRETATCLTVSMHGSPLSRYDNQELAQHIDYRRLGLVGDAVMHVAPDAPYYFTDTGGRWNAQGAANLRDQSGRSPPPGVVPGRAKAFFEFLASADSAIYINAHPERWSSSLADLLYSSAIDRTVRLIKGLVAAARALKATGARRPAR